MDISDSNWQRLTSKLECEVTDFLDDVLDEQFNVRIVINVFLKKPDKED